MLQTVVVGLLDVILQELALKWKLWIDRFLENNCIYLVLELLVSPESVAHPVPVEAPITAAPALSVTDTVVKAGN